MRGSMFTADRDRFVIKRCLRKRDLELYDYHNRCWWNLRRWNPVWSGTIVNSLVLNCYCKNHDDNSIITELVFIEILQTKRFRGPKSVPRTELGTENFLSVLGTGTYSHVPVVTRTYPPLWIVSNNSALLSPLKNC